MLVPPVPLTSASLHSTGPTCTPKIYKSKRQIGKYLNVDIYYAPNTKLQIKMKISYMSRGDLQITSPLKPPLYKPRPFSSTQTTPILNSISLSNLPIYFPPSISRPLNLPKMTVHSNISSPLGPPACEKDAKALQFIEDMTRNTDSVQANVLAEILSRNAHTEYLRMFHLDGATDRETYKSKVPVVGYDELSPYIKRIADGDRSQILSSQPISEFLTRYIFIRFIKYLFPRI